MCIRDSNYRDGNEQTLREFIDRESEFLTTASEIITGVGKSSVRQLKPSVVGRTYVTQERPTTSSPRKRAIKECKLCNHPDGLWACDSLRKMTVNQRWDIAREQRLCFRCLSYGHQGEVCVPSRICGLNGCRSAHHRLLHDENSVGLRPRENNRREEPESQPAQDESVLRPCNYRRGVECQDTYQNTSYSTLERTENCSCLCNKCCRAC